MRTEYLAKPSDEKKATRAAFGSTLVSLADKGLPVVAVDADLTGSTTTNKFGNANPEYAKRLVNVGIAEQNMMDVAAGLALTGKIAFTGSFAVFGTGRAYDQVRNTVCYSKLNVKLCPTHAGIGVGPDGGSHQMLEDVSLMRGLPNMKVLVPACFNSAQIAIQLAAEIPGPVYVRLGRCELPYIYTADAPLELGKAYVLKEGSDVSIFANGPEVIEALQAAEELHKQGISAEVIDVFSVKPLDTKCILASCAKTHAAVVAEEHSLYGGLCSAVSETLATNAPTPCEFVAMNDCFGKSGDPAQLMEYFKLDASSIVQAAKRVLQRKQA